MTNAWSDHFVTRRLKSKARLVGGAISLLLGIVLLPSAVVWGAAFGAEQHMAWQARCINVDRGTDEDVVYGAHRSDLQDACRAIDATSIVYAAKMVKCGLGMPGCQCVGYVLRPVGGKTVHFQPNTNLTLCNGNRFILQGDGNLVLYRKDGSPIWSSWTFNHPAQSLAMQGDGNLVLYGRDNAVIWSTKTEGNPGAFLAIQEDDNIVLYDMAMRVIWSSNTAGK
jgi:hypothetical protein